jgi:hypothetical protein
MLRRGETCRAGYAKAEGAEGCVTGRHSRGPLFCKKQFAMKMFSGILEALWYSTNRARLWIQPHKAF